MRSVAYVKFSLNVFLKYFGRQYDYSWQLFYFSHTHTQFVHFKSHVKCVAYEEIERDYFFTIYDWNLWFGTFSAAVSSSSFLLKKEEDLMECKRGWNIIFHNNLTWLMSLSIYPWTNFHHSQFTKEAISFSVIQCLFVSVYYVGECVYFYYVTFH